MLDRDKLHNLMKEIGFSEFDYGDGEVNFYEYNEFQLYLNQLGSGYIISSLQYKEDKYCIFTASTNMDLFDKLSIHFKCEIRDIKLDILL